MIQKCIPELEGNQKGMDTYDAIETNQDGIEISKLVRTIFHL